MRLSRVLQIVARTVETPETPVEFQQNRTFLLELAVAQASVTVMIFQRPQHQMQMLNQTKSGVSQT